MTEDERRAALALADKRLAETKERFTRAAEIAREFHARNDLRAAMYIGAMASLRMEYNVLLRERGRIRAGIENDPTAQMLTIKTTRPRQ
jgi:hypothetical protein